MYYKKFHENQNDLEMAVVNRVHKQVWIHVWIRVIAPQVIMYKMYCRDRYVGQWYSNTEYNPNLVCVLCLPLSSLHHMISMKWLSQELLYLYTLWPTTHWHPGLPWRPCRSPWHWPGSRVVGHGYMPWALHYMPWTIMCYDHIPDPPGVTVLCIKNCHVPSMHPDPVHELGHMPSSCAMSHTPSYRQDISVLMFSGLGLGFGV